MTINQSGWRPEMGVSNDEPVATYTGNRALMLEEALIFEIGTTDTTGVDIAPAPKVASRLGGLGRNTGIGLPGLSEPETVRHYTRLSRQNYAIDLGLFPLGSCTMKHNPRLNEKLARLPGFADVHPLQPTSTVQGALELIEVLSGWLMELTGAHAVAMSPKAGAHGELCGMMAIKAALAARGIASVAADGFGAPGVVVSFASSLEMQSGKPFAALGMQIAAGVPLQCDEGPEYRSFRLGLFGLDKLYDVDASVARLEQALDQVLAA